MFSLLMFDRIVLKTASLFLFICSISVTNGFATGDTIKIVTGYGPEDLVIDTLNERLLISCDNRRNNAMQGEIWMYDIQKGTARKLLFETPLNFDFHPHGIFLLSGNGKPYLYVINHIYKDQSEIDRFLVLKDKLKLDKRYTDITGKPNDLFVLSKEEFYYTDYKMFGGSIVHFANGTETKVIKNLKMPNGIFIENDTIYFTATLNGKLYKASLNDFKKQTVCKLKGGDNIMQAPDGSFLIASHQKFGKFMKHAKDPAKISPSLVYKVDPETGNKEVIFKDDGNKIPAVSTAVLFKNTLYFGQVFDGFILAIKNFYPNKN